MRLKNPLRIDETRLLREKVDRLNRMVMSLTGNPCVGAPRPDYLRCLKPLTDSPWMVDHLEASSFFLSTFAFLYPGYGAQLQMLNTKVADELGYDWCVEVYAPDGAPIGVRLEGGYECVFSGRTPLEAMVEMLTTFIEHRFEILREVEERSDEMEIRPAMVVEPEALPAPGGEHEDG